MTGSQYKTELAANGEHVPIRPSFDCACCGESWPCAPAKVLLLEEHRGNRLSITMYLSVYMEEALGEAIRDHAWGRVDDLYERFLGWVRQGA